MDPENTQPAAGPWADDLRAALGEEYGGAFDAVDSYMRERVQPRMTELEEGTKDARELWADLNNENEAPTAVAALVRSVFGDEYLEKFVGLFPGDEEETTTPPAAEEETTTPPALGDEERELLEWARAKREQEQATEADNEYTAAKAKLVKAHDFLTENDVKAGGLFDPFVAVAPDLDSAVEMFKQWKIDNGLLQVEETTPADPPPVLGSEGAAAATPPAKPQFTKWDDLFRDGGAMDTYFDNNAATATPPPVIG